MTSGRSDVVTRLGGRPLVRTAAEAVPRHRAALTGTVASVAVRRRAVLPGPVRIADPRACLEAVLDDGTGTVTLRWLGRAQVAGIAVGASIEVEGTVLDEYGRRVLLNPVYSLL